MARKVKDKELDSSEARLKLKPRGKPYFPSERLISVSGS
jgi:phosphopantetheinyl transferase